MRLETQGLSLTYGPVVALRSLSAEVNGSVIGVLGATASGKTSLLQIIAGQIAPSAGQVRIDGQVVLHSLQMSRALLTTLSTAG